MVAEIRAQGIKWGRSFVVGSGLAGIALAAACGIAIRRDLTTMPVGQVSYEDACGLQQYFDTLAAGRVAPPRIASGNELEGERSGRSVHGGHSRFAFETAFQLRTVKRLLQENWSDLPEGLEAAKRIDLDVYWSEVSGLKRVVTERDASLILGMNGEPQTLPYHVCLSELLFGEPLYKERHTMLGLPNLPSVLAPLEGDGGTVLSTDGGAASSSSEAGPSRAVP